MPLASTPVGLIFQSVSSSATSAEAGHSGKFQGEFTGVGNNSVKVRKDRTVARRQVAKKGLLTHQNRRGYRDRRQLMVVNRGGEFSEISIHHIIPYAAISKLFALLAEENIPGCSKTLIRSVVDSYMRAAGVEVADIRKQLIVLAEKGNSFDQDKCRSQPLLKAFYMITWPAWNCVIGPLNTQRWDDPHSGEALDLFQMPGAHPDLIKTSSYLKNIGKLMQPLLKKKPTAEVLTELKKALDIFSSTNYAKRKVFFPATAAVWKCKLVRVHTADGVQLQRKYQKSGEGGRFPVKEFHSFMNEDWVSMRAEKPQKGSFVSKDCLKERELLRVAKKRAKEKHQQKGKRN
ncbi:hypothetical protein [Candidatus Regiella endosymbiont of Tuberolachnus salignus]|uniref:hypothetical protein n=1 Tax=Candidatus Regiella endosymbiont of Tuberolachnus salignus TaxID=3077956 RepID=UPI0030CBAED2